MTRALAFPYSRAMEAARLQVEQAERELDRPISEYLEFPWPSLHQLTGQIPPGSLWYVGGFSGHGKTTFLTSLSMDLLAAGRSIYYLGLESRPNVIRTHFACKVLGIDAGDVLSGEGKKWAEWPKIRGQLSEIVRDQGVEAFANLWICQEEYINTGNLRGILEEAVAWRADLVIVDHVDHIGGEMRGNVYHESLAVNRMLLDAVRQSDVRLLVATQFNNEAFRRDRLAQHVYPQPTYIKNGGHKREVADGMLAVGRPLRFQLDKDALKGYQERRTGPHEVCEPNTMAVYCMKHRLYGNREGERVYLHVQQGKVTDLGQSAYAAAIHGIRTGSTL